MTVAKGMVYSYNVENRLVEASPQNPQQGSVKATYIYDYMGRRARKTLFTYSSGSWQKQKDQSFIYDGWNMVKESEKTSDSSPEVPVYYVWGLDLSQSMQGAGGVGGLIASVKSGNEYLYSFDANGNVGQMIKSTDGSIAARYEYDPFGKTIFSEGPMAGENPYRFSTKYLDGDTGLYYYGFRFYDVELGRWINRDPMDEGGGENLHLFGMNNAVCFYDKLGLLTVLSKEELKAVVGNRNLDPYNIKLSPIDAVRMLYSLPFDFLSGDMFRGEITDDYSRSKCEFLITVTGMITNQDGNITFRDEIAKLARFQNTNANYVYNPTRYLGDVVQALGNEIGAIDTIARTLADKIIKAANISQNNQCGDCYNIYIVAHSQGTMATKRALSLVPTEVKKHIEYWGVGGQIAIQDSDIKAHNYANGSDPVPLANYLPTRLIDNFGWQLGRFETGFSGYTLDAHDALKYVDYLRENME